MVLGWCTTYQSCTVAYSTGKEEGNPGRSLTSGEADKGMIVLQYAIRGIKFMLYREITSLC